jgi:hypothetical protein
MTTTDQNFTLPTNGQSDWDADLNANFTIIGRGFHKLLTAGSDITTGTIVTVSSDGYANMMDPNSLYNKPHAFAYKAVNSGEQDTFLLHGLVRSLGVLSAAIPGQPFFANATSAGFVAASYSGADRPAGIGVEEDGIYFSPGAALFPETITQSSQVSAVTGSTHYFTMDGGRGGFFRRLNCTGASADLVEVKFHANSARSDLLYQTVSGGVSVVGSFIDQAGVPYYNSDASTLSGIVYGTLEVKSDSAVGSDTIDVSVIFERFR